MEGFQGQYKQGGDMQYITNKANMWDAGLLKLPDRLTSSGALPKAVILRGTVRIK